MSIDEEHGYAPPARAEKSPRDESKPPPGWELAIVQNSSEPECFRNSDGWATLSKTWRIYDEEHGYPPPAVDVEALRKVVADMRGRSLHFSSLVSEDSDYREVDACICEMDEFADAIEAAIGGGHG